MNVAVQILTMKNVDVDLQISNTSFGIMGDNITQKMTAENIFNITLGQMDTEFDNDLSSFLEQDVPSQVHYIEDEDFTLFAFEEWRQSRT